MKGLQSRNGRTTEVGCWHEYDLSRCPFCCRSWSISGRNSDIGETTRMDPFQTSAARFALTQTDVPECDSLNAPGVWQERKPTTLGCHPCSRSIVLPIWFELMWGA